jgi:hypothetical protein
VRRFGFLGLSIALALVDEHAGILLNTFTPIEARGNEALVTDGTNSTYLYDGRSLRKVTSGNYAAHW